MSNARLPHDYESPTALLRELFPILMGRQDKRTLCYVYNAATAPNLYRSEDEASACIRIARLCGRIRAARFAGIDCYGRSNGAWSVVSH